MKKRYELKISDSIYTFKLEEVLDKKGISKYQLEKDTGIDHKTINNYCLGTLKRIDLRVIVTMCEYLNCELSDIFELKIK